MAVRFGVRFGAGGLRQLAFGEQHIKALKINLSYIYRRQRHWCNHARKTAIRANMSAYQTAVALLR
tara:strand:- start:111 stop:308 length:198 start_codon:yes stop_codon:yes gene_type:complete